MPQVTVYIRKEDLPLWKEVDKKSEFMHEALNNKLMNKVQYSAEDLKNAETVRLKEIDSSPTKRFNFCKHNAVKGMCKRGCK